MDYKILISKPKTKRGRETLNRIVSAAAQVFYEKGYHNSSINDITRLAGVASGPFMCTLTASTTCISSCCSSAAT